MSAAVGKPENKSDVNCHSFYISGFHGLSVPHFTGLLFHP